MKYFIILEIMILSVCSCSFFSRFQNESEMVQVTDGYKRNDFHIKK